LSFCKVGDVMGLEAILASPAYRVERKDLRVIGAVIERFADERPLAGVRVVISHLLAWNSLSMVEALWRAGARLVLCNGYPSPRTDALFAELEHNAWPVLPIEQAVRSGDYFVDAGGVLGRLWTPRAAAEITRTGELYYAEVPCPVISIDRSRVKRFEDYLGTGESFVRAWREVMPRDPLAGKRLVQFGYGKVGRGVAQHARRAGMTVTIVDPDTAARARAEKAGLFALDNQASPGLRHALARADVVIGVTGVPGAVGRTVPADWLRANRPALVNIGFDEFGPAFGEAEYAGGRSIPINFNLARPTRNCYIDPALAAQVLAVEALVCHADEFPVGIHSLPAEIDRWVLDTWRRVWPEEDVAGVEAELDL
jgi:adenosylhomocysteinase